jgi:hypothetical protein
VHTTLTPLRSRLGALSRAAARLPPLYIELPFTETAPFIAPYPPGAAVPPPIADAIPLSAAPPLLPAAAGLPQPAGIKINNTGSNIIHKRRIHMDLNNTRFTMQFLYRVIVGMICISRKKPSCPHLL